MLISETVEIPVRRCPLKFVGARIVTRARFLARSNGLRKLSFHLSMETSYPRSIAELVMERADEKDPSDFFDSPFSRISVLPFFRFPVFPLSRFPVYDDRRSNIPTYISDIKWSIEITIVKFYLLFGPDRDDHTRTNASHFDF